ncbi:glycosyltransferase family 2 protein [Cellulomonas fengjieae]|uniref:glycosyltransferase family 2 protein n=1 Tax=Cellulomonas fengjieae TaxID=2819978 RepID=UPI001AAF6A7C|nr:glycosyltransferase family 2 protein [Cellulomonas fengjieae]MBO3101393.1 glycosyltransferase family 2 protein [Cellulomonas fengjieae]
MNAPSSRPGPLRLGTGPESRPWRARPPLLDQEEPVLQVQSVLYNTDPEGVERSLASLERAAELAILPDGRRVRVLVRYGDCSPLRVFEDDRVAEIVERHSSALDISYTWFGENLGSARGHNTLAAGSRADFFMTLNPDVVVSPRTITLLLEPFLRTGVGMTEAKQLPVEHPKDYDRSTGETSWAATACAVFPRELFEDIGGFDADTFFMYCDDVDFSWNVRRHGMRVVYQPAATVFHDKRLGSGASWEPTSAEQYYSAEAALLLFHKWSRTDLAERAIGDFDNAPGEHYRAAAEEFRRRRREERLPQQIDSDHEVGVFVEGFYAPHRFAL